MDKLQQARKTIGEVDTEIARLFCRRMEAAQMVAEYKKERGAKIASLSLYTGFMHKFALMQFIFYQ